MAAGGLALPGVGLTGGKGYKSWTLYSKIIGK